MTLEFGRNLGFFGLEVLGFGFLYLDSWVRASWVLGIFGPGIFGFGICDFGIFGFGVFGLSSLGLELSACVQEVWEVFASGDSLGTL